VLSDFEYASHVTLVELAALRVRTRMVAIRGETARLNPCLYSSQHAKEPSMSKGMERKKEGKKKPTKTLEEKRAAKKAKRDARG
jgi:hypothetical protein